MTLPRHPQTGLHYGVVIPPDWGPFTDIRACYEHVARSAPWLSIVSPGQKVAWDDPHLFLLFWSPAAGLPARPQRQATTALVYSEALDPDINGKLMDSHRRHWERVYDDCCSRRYDGVFGHTPYMTELLGTLLSSHHTPTRLLPVGWEPEAMGRPRSSHHPHGLVYHGSMAGRRHALVPYLKARLHPNLEDATGQFGRGLLGALEAAHGSLYIAHSQVASFSTWRLWQALAAGCALLGEPGDSWPFEAGKHYVPFGPLTLDNLEIWGEWLAQVAGNHHAGGEPLIAVADRALSELGHYTTTYCVNEYLIPASVEMRRA